MPRDWHRSAHGRHARQRVADPAEDVGIPCRVAHARPVATCGRFRSVWSFEISAPMMSQSVSRACHPRPELEYPIRTIGKDGGDQTLVRPRIRQNGGSRIFDPSASPEEDGCPFLRFSFSQEAATVIKQACTEHPLRAPDRPPCKTCSSEPALAVSRAGPRSERVVTLRGWSAAR